MSVIAKHIVQTDAKGFKTYLLIEVEYDRESDTVENILKVVAHSDVSTGSIDLIELLENQLSGTLENIISSIDWSEVFAEEREEALEDV
jgi:hypothetical protein